MSSITLLSGRFFVALTSLKRKACGIITVAPSKPNPPHVRHLNDHLARDIGLSEAQVARNRLALPSQTHHHPYG